MPIPDSGVCAAIGYSEASGIPMRMGLIRNHYVGRTFIEPQQSIRHFGVRVKLNPVRSILEGQRVVLVDDSIVRGTTSRKIVRMVRSAGAREVHMRISCPPTISPCFYGVDTPRRSELIAATHTLEEIRKYLNADSVAYLSLDGLTGAVRGGRQSYCTSCYTGVYPVAFPRDEEAYLQLALKLNPDPSELDSPTIAIPDFDEGPGRSLTWCTARAPDAAARLLVGADARAASASPGPAAAAPADLKQNIANLSSLDFPVRMHAARLIRRTPEAQAVPALVEAARRDSNEFVRYRALVLLTGIQRSRHARSDAGADSRPQRSGTRGRLQVARAESRSATGDVAARVAADRGVRIRSPRARVGPCRARTLIQRCSGR